MKKLKHLRHLVLIAILASSLTSCGSAIRLMEISAGHRVKKSVIDTERRETATNKKNVKLVFTPTDGGFGFRLAYQPNYEVQRRSKIRYQSHKVGFVSGLIFAAEIAAFIYNVVYLPTESGGTLADGIEGDAVDWSALSSLQWGGLVGIPLDFLGLSMISDASHTKYTPWGPRAVIRGDPVQIRNHPVTVSLPQFGYQNTYHTNYNGSFDISTNDIIDIINEVPRISDLNSALQTKAIKIDASAFFEGKEAEESFSIYERSSGPLFQALYKKAEKLRNAQ